MKTIHALLTALLSAASLASANAYACAQSAMPRCGPVYPSLVGDSPYAALATPISLRAFDDNGSRYWRGQYELIDRSDRVVIEWSCDARQDGRDDTCGALVDRALPGFDAHGRPDQRYVQLELRYQSRSVFDGVLLFDGSRDGSMPLADPPPVFRIGCNQLNERQLQG
jgi:hypothetical protein